MRFHIQGKSYQFNALPFSLSTESGVLCSGQRGRGVLCSGQRGQVPGTAKGYKDPPVHRRLVGQSQIPPNLSPAYKDTNITLSGVRLASKPREIRTGPQTSIRFCRLPVRPERGQGQTHHRALTDLANKDKGSYDRSGMPDPKTDVFDRVTYSH